jgi:hypothetical protein
MEEPMPEQKYISLRPSDAIETGILSDEDVTFRDLNFVSYDYGGKHDAVFGLMVTMEPEGETEAVEQFYSAGSLDYLAPSDNGKSVIPLTDRPGLNPSCNAFAFINSIVQAGFPQSQFQESIEPFVGMKVHVIREEQKRRSGLNSGGENERKPTILLVSKIHSRVGEETPDNEIDESVVEYIEAVSKAALENAGGSMSYKEYKGLMMRAFMADKSNWPPSETVHTLAKISSSDVFATSSSRPWLFDDGEMTLIPA